MRRKKNIYFLIFTPVLFGISIVVFLFANSIRDSLFEVSMWLLLASILWITGLIWNFKLMYEIRSLNRTYWKTPIFLGTSLLILGCLFKTRNWTGGEIIILASCLMFLVSYGKHFLQKKNKIFLDYSKVLFAISAFILSILLSFQVNNVITSVVLLCCIILQINLIIVFYCHLYKQKSI